VLSLAGAYAKEEVCRTLVVHISNAPKLHAYAARQAFRSLQEHQKYTNLLLLTTTAWLLGETPPPSPPAANLGSCVLYSEELVESPVCKHMFVSTAMRQHHHLSLPASRIGKRPLHPHQNLSTALPPGHTRETGNPAPRTPAR